jgi:hypothetical protein
MENLLRTAAKALAGLAEKAHQWADWAGDWEAEGDPRETSQHFAGVDIVGLDFSTSIRQVASHVIHGWDNHRYQLSRFRSDHGVWAFGVNAMPFPLTRGPASPGLLPGFHLEHFQRRGHGRGMIEYGSAFYDYFLVALGYAQQLGVFDPERPAPLPITISLLCDGYPNGGMYRASDVQRLVEQARARMDLHLFPG